MNEHEPLPFSVPDIQIGPQCPMTISLDSAIAIEAIANSLSHEQLSTFWRVPERTARRRLHRAWEEMGVVAVPRPPYAGIGLAIRHGLIRQELAPGKLFVPRVLSYDSESPQAHFRIQGNEENVSPRGSVRLPVDKSRGPIGTVQLTLSEQRLIEVMEAGATLSAALNMLGLNRRHYRNLCGKLGTATPEQTLAQVLLHGLDKQVHFGGESAGARPLSRTIGRYPYVGHLTANRRSVHKDS